MDIRRLIPILIGIILISFGIGIYSLRYYDNFTFERFNNNEINTNGKDFINVKSKDSNVRIGTDGIQVNDGDDYVSIGWNGISVIDGNEQVEVGWDGIKVKDGDKEVRRMSNIGLWLGIFPKNLDNHKVNEEKHENIDGINSIKISSNFVDIKVKQENRDDVWIKYHGTMVSNVVPILETQRKGNVLNIKLTSNKNSYTVTESNVVLEIVVPQTFENEINISSSSADVHMNDIIGSKLIVSTSSGDVNLKNIQGKNSSITTSSGDMNLEKLESNANLTSSSGDIKLFVNRSSGDVKISTSSGDVSVFFDNDANYTVLGTTSSGDIATERTISMNDKGGRFEFSVGTGDKEMRISTSSGDFYFK